MTDIPVNPQIQQNNPYNLIDGQQTVPVQQVSTQVIPGQVAPVVQGVQPVQWVVPVANTATPSMGRFEKFINKIIGFVAKLSGQGDPVTGVWGKVNNPANIPVASWTVSMAPGQIMSPQWVAPMWTVQQQTPVMQQSAPIQQQIPQVPQQIPAPQIVAQAVPEVVAPVIPAVAPVTPTPPTTPVVEEKIEVVEKKEEVKVEVTTPEVAPVVEEKKEERPAPPAPEVKDESVSDTPPPNPNA